MPNNKHIYISINRPISFCPAQLSFLVDYVSIQHGQTPQPPRARHLCLHHQGQDVSCDWSLTKSLGKKNFFFHPGHCKSYPFVFDSGCPKPIQILEKEVNAARLTVKTRILQPSLRLNMSARVLIRCSPGMNFLSMMRWSTTPGSCLQAIQWDFCENSGSYQS